MATNNISHSMQNLSYLLQFHRWHSTSALATTNTSHPMQNFDYLLQFYLWRIPSASVCIRMITLHSTQIITTRIRHSYLCLSLAGAATSIIFVNVCRDIRVSRNKTRLLSRQKYACRDKRFVGKELCLSRQNIFVATKLLSLQNTSFVATKAYLSKQNFCRDKYVILVAAPASDTCQPFV